jgi:hypothetical protein
MSRNPRETRSPKAQNLPDTVAKPP